MFLGKFLKEKERKREKNPPTKMIHVKSDSDVTSVDPSSPRSSKRPIYYYQSPSRESNDGDKSSHMHATPVSDSPMESPSHPSYWRHSRTSSESRFSGPVRSFSETTLKGNGMKRNEKGWPECDVIKEEGNYGDLYEDEGVSRRLQVLIGIVAFVVIFSVFCLIIWGASRPYSAEITVKVCLIIVILFCFLYPLAFYLFVRLYL